MGVSHPPDSRQPHITQTLKQDGQHNSAEQTIYNYSYNGPPPIEPARYVKAEKWDWGKWDKNDILRPLLPKSASAPFVGRELELTGLKSLMAETHGAIAAGVVTGRGGAGKTRLARHFCDSMPGAGWNVHILGREQVDFWANQNPVYWSENLSSDKTLLVIDYAAAYAGQLHHWLMRLLPAKERMRSQGKFLRLVLLDREASFEHGWLKALCGGTGDCFYELKGLFPYPVWALPSVSPEDAFQIYTNILEGMDQAVPDGQLARLNEKISQADWSGNPLYIIMAAICRQHAEADIFNMSRAKLAFKVAELQAKKIDELAKGQNIEGYLLKHLTACLTLRQGLFENEFNDFLQDEFEGLNLPVQALSSEMPDKLLAALKTILSFRTEERPGRNRQNSKEYFILPLLPDVIGEAFTLQILSGKTPALFRSYQADPLATFEVLSRMVQDFGRVEPVDLGLDRAPASIKHWLGELLDRESSDLESLKRLSSNLSRSNVFLSDFNAEVDARLVEIA